MTRRRLLVTGGSGFIGTNLVATALEAGDEVRNLDRNPPLDTRQHPHWRRCDILDAGGSDNISLIVVRDVRNPAYDSR